MKSSIPAPSLCVVTDRTLFPEGSSHMIRCVEAAVAGGVNIVQLRERDLPGAPLLELAQHLRRITQGTALLVVNERLDVATACGADGVQLGEAGMSVKAARAVVGDDMLIGRSVHSVDGAVTAEEQGADYLVAGTIFASRTHEGIDPAGPGLLTGIARRVHLPILGIGGISIDNIDRVIKAGATGAAVISAILGSDDPEHMAQDMMSKMANAAPKVKTEIVAEAS